VYRIVQNGFSFWYFFFSRVKKKKKDDQKRPMVPSHEILPVQSFLSGDSLFGRIQKMNSDLYKRTIPTVFFLDTFSLAGQRK
jgi:hypothetical protein